jgi:hypothetical protein
MTAYGAGDHNSNVTGDPLYMILNAAAAASADAAAESHSVMRKRSRPGNRALADAAMRTLNEPISKAEESIRTPP